MFSPVSVQIAQDLSYSVRLQLLKYSVQVRGLLLPELELLKGARIVGLSLLCRMQTCLGLLLVVRERMGGMREGGGGQKPTPMTKRNVTAGVEINDLV